MSGRGEGPATRLTRSAGGRGRPTRSPGRSRSDESDRTRAVSPLMVAPDAVYIDTTGVAIADVTRQVEALVKRALAGAVEPQETDRHR